MTDQPKRWIVQVNEGHSVFVTADYCIMKSDGTLVFHDLDEIILAAFAPGKWQFFCRYEEGPSI